MFRKLIGSSVACAFLVFPPTVSLAQAPFDISGTWVAVANQTTGWLVMTQRVNERGRCQTVTGTMLGTPISGLYCPRRGRLTFLRMSATGTPIQFYQGYLGSSSSTYRIGGTYSLWNTSAPGYSIEEGADYNFSAIK
jgi:hypothetical protein